MTGDLYTKTLSVKGRNLESKKIGYVTPIVIIVIETDEVSH